MQNVEWNSSSFFPMHTSYFSGFFALLFFTVFTVVFLTVFRDGLGLDFDAEDELLFVPDVEGVDTEDAGLEEVFVETFPLLDFGASELLLLIDSVVACFGFSIAACGFLI